MNCDRCDRTGICKFEDSARSFEEHMRLSIPDGKPDCISVFMKCENFKFKYQKPQQGK